MPAPKPRRRRAFAGILSSTELAFIRDDPERRSLQWMALRAGRDARDPKSKAALAWRSGSPGALRDWIRRHPGTRPSCWWAFEAPEPFRRVVRGRGEPTCGMLDVAIGRATHWRHSTSDLAIESQAAFLKRHGLMTAGEAQRLPSSAFEPEAIFERDERAWRPPTSRDADHDDEP
jgi:hypothetical protein